MCIRDSHNCQLLTWVTRFSRERCVCILRQVEEIADRQHHIEVNFLQLADGGHSTQRLEDVIARSSWDEQLFWGLGP
eukprot:5262881-Amphidinium_carterae.1